MATSLVSTGVQFPDSTIQTTASTAVANIGDVLYSTQAPNSSWLLCDGTVYPKSSYPTLATRLGTLSDPYAGTWGNVQSGYPNFVYTWLYSGTWYSLSSAQYSFQYGIYSRTGYGGATVTKTLDLSSWSSPTMAAPWASNAFIMGDYYGQTRLVSAPYTSLGTAGTGENWGNNRAVNGLISNGSSIALHFGRYGDYCGTNIRRVYRTTNGYTWSDVTANLPSFDGSTSGEFYSGVYGAGLFVVGLYQNNNDSNTFLAYSSDGSTWYDCSTSYGRVQSITYAGGYFWCITYNSSNQTSVLRSSNGTSWTRVWFGGSYTGANINIVGSYQSVITADTTGLIAVAQGGAYWLSTDLGVTWSLKSSPNTGSPSPNNSSFVRPDRGGTNGNTMLINVSNSNPTYYTYTGTLYTYDPTTSFKMPTFSPLSTLSGTYSAPVYAYMKAA